MGIINRDHEISEKRDVVVFSQRTLVTGASYIITQVPYKCDVQGAYIAAIGLSGSPILSFNAIRFNATGGQTVINLGVSGAVLNAYGTSGILGFSGMQSLGSSLLSLLPGDLLAMTLTGANSAVDSAIVDIVLAKSEDYVKIYSLPT